MSDDVEQTTSSPRERYRVMSYDNDPNALASALPAGIIHNLSWRARQIAEFQAERLAESGYRLVYVGDNEYVKQLMVHVMQLIEEIEGVNGDKDGLD